MPKKLKVYLSGPMTGCNNQQKTAWRSAFKKEILKFGFESIDPTDNKAKIGPFAALADIETADIVVANMWKESIGTVVGIMQARRLGIPVILIDPNYINSEILRRIVDYEPVRSLDL